MTEGTERNRPAWWGSVASPLTPWDDKDRIDEDALASEVEFCIRAGVGGISYPMMTGEVFELTEDEMRTAARVTLKAAAGRVPVLINCTAISVGLAAEYARHAAEAGADAVIAMGRRNPNATFDEHLVYYGAIADAAGVPVWIQNHPFAHLSAEQAIRLCEKIELVSWIKEENPPEDQRIEELARLDSPHVEGIVGGSGGVYSIWDWEAGAQGVIHACCFCDVVQQVWNRLADDELPAARDLMEKLLPALQMERKLDICKEILVRRGVLKNNRTRWGNRGISERISRDINRALERIQPLLTA